MPSIISHAAVAVAAGMAFEHRNGAGRFWTLSVACSITADADRNNIFFYAHTDDTGNEGLFQIDPKVKTLWAHAGMSAIPETVSRLLDRYPSLFVELSIRSDIATDGKLHSAWKALFIRHLDRVLVGSDTWITSRWESFVSIHAEIRKWLIQLPRDIAERLAFKNSFRLIRKP